MNSNKRRKCSDSDYPQQQARQDSYGQHPHEPRDNNSHRSSHEHHGPVQQDHETTRNSERSAASADEPATKQEHVATQPETNAGNGIAQAIKNFQNNNSFIDNFKAQEPYKMYYNSDTMPRTPPREESERGFFKKKTQQGVDRAKKLVADRFAQEQRRRQSHNQDSDSDSDDYCIGAGVPTVDVEGFSQDAYIRFVESLPYSVFLTLGFDSSRDICICPCSAGAKKWRMLFQVVSPGCRTNKNKTGEFQAQGLGEHLRTEKQYCLFHAATWEYLQGRYSDYWAETIDHKDLHPALSPPYKAAEERKDQHSKARHLRLEKQLVQAKQRANQAEGEREKLKNLLFGVLQIDPDKDLAEEEEDDPQSSFQEFAGYLQYIQTLLHPSITQQDLKKCITISVDQHTEIEDLFHQWCGKGEKDPTYLFRSLSKPKRSDFYYAFLHLRHWIIQYGALDRKTKVEEDMAIDEGGPTRAFLTTVWDALGMLEVRLPGNKTIRLFTGMLCVPLDDGTIEDTIVSAILCQERELMPAVGKRKDISIEASERRAEIVASKGYKEVLGMVHKFYRAIGRIMAHVIATNNSVTTLTKQDEDHEGLRGPTAIPGHVVPLLYRNTLLRDLEPDSPKYKLADLASHVAQILLPRNDEDTPAEEVFEFLKGYVEQELEDEDTQGKMSENKDFREKFRKWAQSYFIDKHSIALTGLKEGLYLGGAFEIVHHFHNKPLASLSKMFFFKDTVTVEELVNVMVATVACERNPELANKYLEIHRKVMTEVLPEVLESLQKEDNEFLQKFLFFCTGHRYIADMSYHQDGCRLKVEFNFKLGEHHLPEAKTCDYVLILQGQAYEGDAETMKIKLKQAVEECSATFQTL